MRGNFDIEHETSNGNKNVFAASERSERAATLFVTVSLWSMQANSKVEFWRMGYG